MFKKFFLLLSYSTLFQLSNNIGVWIILIFIIKNHGIDSLYFFLIISAINQIINIVSSFGLQEYIFLKTSRLKEKFLPQLRSIYSIGIITSFLIYILICIFLYFKDINLLNVFILLGINSIFLNFNIINNYLIALKKIKRITILRYSLLLFLICVLYFKNELTLQDIYIFYTFYTFIIFLTYNFIFIKKYNLDFNFLKKIIIKNFYVLLSNFITIFRGRASVLILDIFLSKTGLSTYGLITRIIEAVNLIFNYAVRIITYDIISKKSFLKTILQGKHKSLIYFFVIVILSYVILNLSFDYGNISSVTNYSVLIFLCIYLSYLKIQEHLFKNNFINKDNQNIFFKSTIVSSILSVIIFSILTHYLNLKGALIGYIISAHFVFYINSLFYREYL